MAHPVLWPQAECPALKAQAAAPLEAGLTCRMPAAHLQLPGCLAAAQSLSPLACQEEASSLLLAAAAEGPAPAAGPVAAAAAVAAGWAADSEEAVAAGWAAVVAAGSAAESGEAVAVGWEAAPAVGLVAVKAGDWAAADSVAAGLAAGLGEGWAVVKAEDWAAASMSPAPWRELVRRGRCSCRFAPAAPRTPRKCQQHRRPTNTAGSHSGGRQRRTQRGRASAQRPM